MDPSSGPLRIVSGEVVLGPEDQAEFAQRLERVVYQASGDSVLLVDEVGFGGTYSRSGERIVLTFRDPVNPDRILRSDTLALLRRGVLRRVEPTPNGSLEFLYRTSAGC